MLEKIKQRVLLEALSAFILMIALVGFLGTLLDLLRGARWLCALVPVVTVLLAGLVRTSTLRYSASDILALLPVSTQITAVLSCLVYAIVRAAQCALKSTSHSSEGASSAM